MEESDFERVQRVVVTWAPMASASYLADFTLAIMDAVESSSRVDTLAEVAERIESLRSSYHDDDKNVESTVRAVLGVLLSDVEMGILDADET